MYHRMAGGGVMVACVYIIAHEEADGVVGPVKVGITSDPHARLKSLQTGNPRPLILAAFFVAPDREIASLLEGAFHGVMKKDTALGEWFHLTPRQAVIAMCWNFKSFLRWQGHKENEIQKLLKASYRVHRKCIPRAELN